MDIRTEMGPKVGETTRLDLSQELAKAGGEVILNFFRSGKVATDTKDCVSAIVTEADRKAERVMRQIIEKRFPDDGIIGEELGTKESTSGFSWVIDPIDGTSSFVRGLPTFGVLIGLVNDRDRPVLGVCFQPYLDEMLLGEVDKSTLLIKGQDETASRLVVNPYVQSAELTLDDVCLSSTTPLMFTSEDEKRVASHMQKRCPKNAFGGDCMSYAMMASGKTTMPLVVLEADLKYYDFCALIPIIEGSGGVVTDWEGRPPCYATSQLVAAPNQRLHELALAEIRKAREKS